MMVPARTVPAWSVPRTPVARTTVPGISLGGLTGQVMIIAKEPVPGRVKTRLTPPFTPRQAADLAQAALADTLAAAAGVPAARHVIALDGAPDGWLPAGVHVLAQRGAGLDERIAAALGDAYDRLAVPVVLIGMDTPQVTPALLEAALRPLADGSADAAFGPAADGGFWLLGLRRPDPALVLGVPMSTAATGAAQIARLAAAGLRIRYLPCLRDVDTAADAVAVARQAPRTRFAATLAALLARPALSRACPPAAREAYEVVTASLVSGPTAAALARFGSMAGESGRGPMRPEFWRSPLRGPWLTSVLGLVLLCGLPVVALTGLLSYAAYDPRLPGNDQTPGGRLLKFYLFDWPAGPAWLYRVSQGVHVTLALALVPVVAVKLWSVAPRLFAWPPARSVSHALERLSLIMVVGGVLFEFATGILDIQDFYVFPFSFYTAHLYGAWVFIAGLTAHVALKLGRMRAGLRSRQRPAGDPADPGSLTPVRPAAPTISRRGLLAAMAGASAILGGLVAGQSLGGWARRTALFGPRGRSAAGTLPVNRTAAAIGLTTADVGPAYRLTLVGARRLSLTRAQVAALPQRSAALPIACVEGWSAQAWWSGVRLADLARLAGVPRPGGALVESIERRGSFRSASLSAAQVTDPRSLLALRVNGADLSWDHGYPARTIIPAAPGVHNTKWVSVITFVEAG